MTKYFIRAAIIAALYAALSLIFHPISFNQIQVRISESLAILPFFFPEAIWGLTIGCVLANLSSPFGWVDILFGSLCTLIAALLTYQLRHTKKPWLGLIPPVLINAFGVGLYVSILTREPPSFQWLYYLSIVLFIAMGQIISVGGGGSLLIHFIHKYKEKLV